MVHLKGNGPHQIAARKGQFDKLKEWVHCCMLYLACEMRPFLTLFRFKLNIRGPPDVLHFKKITKWRTFYMSEWIRIRVKDFYKDAVGEMEYTYVSREVYEALADTFRKEAHAQEMKDLRHTTKDGYTEGETEDLMNVQNESLEDMVIRQMELEMLQKAMQSLTEVQRERLHLYFFEGFTYRQIAEQKGIGEKNVRESIIGAMKKIKKFFD